MAKKFGWAYVVGRQGSGPKGAVQLAGSGVELEHDPNLFWSDEDNALLVSGDIVAHNFEIQNQTKTVFNFEVSGSSIFGDTLDDNHRFTGSLDITGNVSADNFYGWGGDLDGVPINYATNFADNRIITSVTGDTVNAEENLTFDGALLSVVGDLNALEIDASQFSGSIALFGSADVEDLEVLEFTDGTLSIQTGSISSAGHIQSTTFEGLLTTPSQPNITEVGTLTSLNVANDATINGTLYVKSAEGKIGVNVSDPQATKEILSPTTQLRLTSQRPVFGIQSHAFTDLHTNTDGNFSISPSSNLTNIVGNAVITGDLMVSGTLSAKVTDFNVSADTLTFGDESSDSIIVNARTMTAPNDLEINSVLFVSPSTVGVGAHSTAKFGVTSTSDQLQLGNGSQNLSISVTNGSTSILTNNLTLDIGNNTNVLGQLVVGSNGDIVLDNAGQLSSSVSVSSHTGHFTNITSTMITNGNSVINNDSIQTPTLDAPTVNATNLVGTLNTAAQPNITSLGTLTSLNVANAANIGGPIAVNKSSAARMVEIKDSSNAQLRLTNSEFVFGLSQNNYTDFNTNANGELEISPSAGKVVMPQLKLTNVQQGTSNNFLSVDANGDLVICPPYQTDIEVRNRTVVTADYSVAVNDYFVGIQATQNLVVTLPNASTLFNGQIMVIKDELENADQFTIQLAAQPNQFIENRQSITLSSPGSAVNIYCDGQSKFFIM